MFALNLILNKIKRQGIMLRINLIQVFINEGMRIIFNNLIYHYISLGDKKK